MSATIPRRSIDASVALLTGGVDRPYAFGLAMSLTSTGTSVEFIGSDDLDRPEYHDTPGLRFLNLRGAQRSDAPLADKIRRILVYYVRLLRYTAAAATPGIFHILWNNKFETFDRTLLMLYYKLHGKKIVLTAHNVNAGARDATDSLLNRLTLRIQYLLADHIFVHTARMKADLLAGFGVKERVVTVIPFGINDSVPKTALTPAQARHQLGLRGDDKTILFFGRIAPYKGLHTLVAAFERLSAVNPEYRLIIAGDLGEGCADYWNDIRRVIDSDALRDRVITRITYVPDAETELYFKAADVLALPYTAVSQSGVLFLSYGFGLPVIAANVGSFADDVVSGETGFLCHGDADGFAQAIETYFRSDLFRELDSRRPRIRDHARARHSWDVVADMTRHVYSRLTAQNNGNHFPAPHRIP
jgi:D-inositol-3-phosphate glycosyltransferase